MADPIDFAHARAMRPLSADELHLREARSRLKAGAIERNDNSRYRYMVQRLETEGGHVSYVPQWGLLTDPLQDPSAISWRAINGSADTLPTAIAMCDSHFKNLLKVNETYFLQPQTVSPQ